MNDIRYGRAPRAVWRASRSFLVAAVPPAPPTRVVGSAAQVWQALAEPKTLDELAATIAAATGAAPEQVRADLAALIEQLLPLGLVEVVG